MAQGLDLTEQEQASLAELAELDMQLARHVHAHALAADDPATIAEMARSYQRIARSARQSLALTAKLRRDAARDALEAAREARLKADRDAILAPLARFARPAYEPYDYEDEDEDEEVGPGDEAEDDACMADADAPVPAPASIDPAVLAREAELRTAMRRLIWDERERLETDETAEDLFILLEERLEAVRRWPAPAARPLDEDVAEVCRILNLPVRALAEWRSLPDPGPPPEAASPSAPASPAPQPPAPDPADPWRSSA